MSTYIILVNVDHNYKVASGPVRVIREKLEDCRNWIEVEEETPGNFQIVNNGMTFGGNWDGESALTFNDWSDEVIDLRADTPFSHRMDEPEEFMWNEVKFGPYDYKVSSLDRLIEVLGHVYLGTWCPDDN